MCKRGVGFFLSFVLSKQKPKLNKGTTIYTKGMNWWFLAHTSFPVWIHMHKLFAITAFTPLKGGRRKT